MHVYMKYMCKGSIYIININCIYTQQVCYSYVQHKTKLDPRSKRGIFVGYDKESPAFLIYYPDLKKVMRCRCVKFTDSLNIDEKLINVDDDFPGNVNSSDIDTSVVEIDNIVPVEVDEPVVNVTDVPNVTDSEVLDGDFQGGFVVVRNI